MPERLEIRIGEPVEVEFERLRFSVRRREVGEDGGHTIEVSGPVAGEPAELLRFDLFRRGPHYHVPATNPSQIDLDPVRDGDPLEFVVACLRDRLAALLAQAQFPELASSIGALGPAALAGLAERVRAAVKAAPEPSSSYEIELPAPAPAASPAGR
jgi:hypothetical protein